MKDIEIVLENLTSQDIKLNQTQKLFLDTFIELDALYRPPSFFSQGSTKGSFYLWGPVGRGKTLLLQAIDNSYFPLSGRFHFIEFMQLIHLNLSEISNTKDPLLAVAKDISNKYNIIFIDEFQIEDIADAMIIGVVIESLINNGVRIMISSNTHPDDLYRDGLQRNKFLKTIQFIKYNFETFNLLGKEDYRLREVASFNSPNDDNKYSNIQNFLEKTFEKKLSNNFSFTVNNREFKCHASSKFFIWLSFEDFFIQPCGNKDFIKLVATFDWIFISDFHQCNDDHLNKIRRFISFIDIAYQENKKLKLFFGPDFLENFYQGEQLKGLWARTASRLHEISSNKYLQNLEKK